jgi:GDP/UDP-N,N'-diacetylbacillosamine 2-epimerase (hydrolysing)
MGIYRKIKLGILTSSRADFGFYLPLLKLINKNSDDFELEIIAFGTHLSKFHGYTKADIIKSGFNVNYEISSLLLTDDANSIATGYALTALKFADFWREHQKTFDWVLCLGDRFEMAAAVAAAIPFGIKIGHIHGGETTLGAIDNIYRHSITLASKLHFVSAELIKKRIIELVGSDSKCYVTGSLSLDNLDEISFLKEDEFFEKWGIKMSDPFILVTVHPETIAYDKNEGFAFEIIMALQELLNEKQIVITMPNADTAGTIFRKAFHDLKARYPDKIVLIENFGTQSYFTAMKYAEYMIGNTSSGIVEAASFQKYVINLGDRQKGRLAGENVIHVSFNHKEIIENAKKIKQNRYSGPNIYKVDKAAPIILDALRINTKS